MTTRRSRAAATLVAAVLLGFASSATPAAADDIDGERFDGAGDAHGFLALPSTRTPGHFVWTYGAWTSFGVAPLVLGGGDDEHVLIAHRTTFELAVQVGLGRLVAVGVALPLVFQSLDASFFDESRSLGLSDVRASGRITLWGETPTRDRPRAEGPGVALVVDASFPTGRADRFTTDGVVTTAARLVADFHVLGAGAGASLGYRHRFDAFRGPDGARVRDAFDAAIALRMPLPWQPRLSALVETRLAVDAGAPFERAREIAGEVDLGVRLQLGELVLTLAGGPGFGGAAFVPDVRAIFGVHFEPKTADADGDGVPDADDECPFLPEDFDGFLDRDGCLDPDNDNDLVPDADDRCPNDAADEFADDDEDGCTDPFVDGDGDGIRDAADACPADAEDDDDFQDEDGCPDADDDGDGVLDRQDECPRDAEDVDSYLDADGCPDPDNDDDGVPDASDACPLVRGDVTAATAGSGCPVDGADVPPD